MDTSIGAQMRTAIVALVVMAAGGWVLARGVAAEPPPALEGHGDSGSSPCAYGFRGKQPTSGPVVCEPTSAVAVTSGALPVVVTQSPNSTLWSIAYPDICSSACGYRYHAKDCRPDAGSVVCEKDPDPCETQREVGPRGVPLRRWWKHADGGVFSEDIDQTRRVCPLGVVDPEGVYNIRQGGWIQETTGNWDVGRTQNVTQ